MSLRGRINQHVLDWRFERAMRQYERKHEQAANDPRWARSEGLFNFAWNIVQFCLLAIVTFALGFIALCFLSATYPATTCAALSILGLCN